MSPELIPPCGTKPSRARPDWCIASFASVLHAPRQYVSGHQTKSLIPKEFSPSSKLQLNQCSPILSYCSNTKYVCCTMVSQIMAVHFLTANSNIFTLFVLMIHMPQISTTRLWCVHITLSLIQWRSTQEKWYSPRFFTTDITPTTDEDPQLHRQSRHQWRQTFLN